MLIQQIFIILLINFCPMGPIGNAVRALPSHPIGHFPWDSHGNSIPMDKLGYSRWFEPTGNRRGLPIKDFINVIMPPSHFGVFNCDTANNSQYSLSAVSVESPWSLCRVSVEAQSIVNPLQIETPRRLYGKHAEARYITIKKHWWNCFWNIGYNFLNEFRAAF